LSTTTTTWTATSIIETTGTERSNQRELLEVISARPSPAKILPSSAQCGRYPNLCTLDVRTFCLGKRGQQCDEPLSSEPYRLSRLRKPISELETTPGDPAIRLIGSTFNAAKYGQCPRRYRRENGKKIF